MCSDELPVPDPNDADEKASQTDKGAHVASTAHDSRILIALTVCLLASQPW